MSPECFMVICLSVSLVAVVVAVVAVLIKGQCKVVKYTDLPEKFLSEFYIEQQKCRSDATYVKWLMHKDNITEIGNNHIKIGDRKVKFKNYGFDLVRRMKDIAEDITVRSYEGSCSHIHGDPTKTWVNIVTGGRSKTVFRGDPYAMNLLYLICVLPSHEVFSCSTRILLDIRSKTSDILEF